MTVRHVLLLAALAFAFAPAPLGAVPAASAGAPRVSGVAVTSDAGADTTYAGGETIRVTVTFTEAVAVDTTGGTPRLSIDMDPAAWGEKRALYAGGSGTAVLVFAHTVVEPNLSTEGVAVLANTLAPGGGTIRSASGADAALGHGGLAHDAAHKVDWRISTDGGTARDTTPPRLLRGEVDGGTMRLFFSEALDPDSTGGRFMVDLSTARLTSNFDAAGPVSVDGNVVTVGLGAGNPRAEAGRLDHNRVLYIRRADGGGGALRDLAGNLVTAPDVLPVGDGVEWRYVRMALANVTAPAPDSTPPRLLRGEIDGGTVTLFFSEALDPDAAGGAFHVQVQTSANDVTSFFATGAVAIDGAVVKVGVGAGRPRARAGLTEMNYAYYLAPLVPASGGLRDLSGNPVETPSAHPGGRSRTRILNLDNVTVATPAVTGVAVTSVADGDATYALGETVRVRLTFSEAVNVTGTPRLKLDLGAGAERWAVYESGGGTAALSFAWTVALGDASGAGVAVLANTLALNGGSIRAAARSKDADLAHVGLAPDPVHKVDGTPDMRPPRLSATAVAGTKLTLSFDETIDAEAPPSSGAFTVKRTPPAGAGETVGLSGTPAIEGATVTLTLAEAVRGTDRDVKVSYRRSDSGTGGRLRDTAGNEVAGFADEPVTNFGADTTPPRLVRGEIDGGTVTLYFSEPMDPRYVGGTFRVIVQTSPRRVQTVDATGDVAISGNVVTVGLGEGKPRTKTGLPSNYVEYIPPEQWDIPPRGSASRLRDRAGNLLRTPAQVCEASGCRLSTGSLGLDNVTGDPSVTGVAVSSDAGDDRTYARGEIVRVTVTFHAPVTVTGTPRLKLDLGSGAGAEKWADYERSSGVATLVFAWTVAQADTSNAGVAVLANTLELNGGAIRGVLKGRDANLAHGGLAHNLSHKVAGTLADATPPALYGKVVAGTKLTLAFNEPLGAAASLTNGPFTVKKTPQGGGEQTVTLTGKPAIDGAMVTLTLASAVLETDTNVKVSYARPTSGTGNRLRDAVGNEAASFAGELVANAGDTTPPTLVRGEVDGGTMTLYFSETLDPDSIGGSFVVSLEIVRNSWHTARARGKVEISGNTVTVGLDVRRARAGLRADVYYWKPVAPAAKALRDVAGNPVRTPRHANGGKQTRYISLSNLTGVAPAVTAVAVSSAAGGDATYGLGEKIRVRLTFSKAVAVTGTPRVRIDFSSATGDERWADYEEGSGTKTLEFAYTVARGDASSAGVAVLANTLELNGGAIESALTAGENAALAHAGLGHDPAHMVDGQAAPGGAGGSGGAKGASGSGGPPSVTGVAVTSEPGEDATYGFGETIRVALTFSEAVTVTGSPKLSIDMDPAEWGEKQAAYESGDGTSSLTFAHTVVEPNYSSQGIAVLANSLGLDGGTIRSAATGANAALGHTGLGHDAGHKVDWRPDISVADARANEGADAAAAFEVSLSRAFAGAGHRVTVDYATADGSATAGEDYTAASGTLTFTAGERVKTVSVAILDDSHDEGEETFTLRLSSATGARIGDGEATGTIVNTDPMPRAWLARFGRTLAEQVVDAVGERLAAPRGGGGQARIAGQELAGGGGLDADESARLADQELARWLAGRPEQPRTMSGGELLAGSAFSVTSAAAQERPAAALWGRGGWSRFEGREGSLSVEGEVTTALLGAEVASGAWLGGVMLSHARGDGSYRAAAGAGTVASTLTAAHPYLGVDLSERLTVWAAGGLGLGGLTLTPAGAAALETDLSLVLAALGARGRLVEPTAGSGFSLAIETDAYWVRTSSAAAPGLAETQADATRIRLGLDGGYRIGLGRGGTVEPTVAVGVRHDGGDAETGYGMDVGGGLAWSAPALGLSAQVAARGLLTAEFDGFRDLGLSGSLAWDSDPASDRGPSLSVTQTMGAAATGGSQALLGRSTLAGLAAAEHGLARARLDLRAGYGFAAAGDRFTLTPEFGFGLSETSRDYTLGVRLGLAQPAPAAFEFGIEATRRESGGHHPEHGLGLTLTASW